MRKHEAFIAGKWPHIVAMVDNPSNDYGKVSIFIGESVILLRSII